MEPRSNSLQTVSVTKAVASKGNWRGQTPQTQEILAAKLDKKVAILAVPAKKSADAPAQSSSGNREGITGRTEMDEILLHLHNDFGSLFSYYEPGNASEYKITRKADPMGPKLTSK